jgi:hypothetical protein
MRTFLWFVPLTSSRFCCYFQLLLLLLLLLRLRELAEKCGNLAPELHGVMRTMLCVFVP